VHVYIYIIICTWYIYISLYIYIISLYIYMRMYICICYRDFNLSWMLAEWYCLGWTTHDIPPCEIRSSQPQKRRISRWQRMAWALTMKTYSRAMWDPEMNQLVYNSHFTMVYGRYNELVNGVYKPTYNWWASFHRFQMKFVFHGAIWILEFVFTIKWRWVKTKRVEVG